MYYNIILIFLKYTSKGVFFILSIFNNKEARFYPSLFIIKTNLTFFAKDLLVHPALLY